MQLAPSIAKVKQIEPFRDSYIVEVQQYYRPEDSQGGRKRFHGFKELVLSDDITVHTESTIKRKCTVHSLKTYTKLENELGPDDYYSRFHYKANTGAFSPDRVAVYCKCEMPYNPDYLMVQCEGCSDWFHLTCVEVTREQAKLMEQFMCTGCAAASDAQMEAPSKRRKKRPLKCLLSSC